MDKKFGKYEKKRAWVGISIRLDDNEDQENDDEDAEDDANDVNIDDL